MCVLEVLFCFLLNFEVDSGPAFCFSLSLSPFLYDHDAVDVLK